MAIAFYTVLILVFGVCIVCLTIIHARLNPGQNDAASRAGRRAIGFFTRYQKPLRRIGYLVMCGLAAASGGYIVWFFLQTLPRNPDAKNRIDEYIENSTTLALTYMVPQELAAVLRSSDYEVLRPVYEKYNHSRTIYTGLSGFGRRARPEGDRFHVKIFQDRASLDYYRIVWATSGPGAGQLQAFGSMLDDGVAVEARVNRDELTAPGAGTPENPIPILMWTLPGRKTRESYAEYWITEPQYRAGVYLYLAYILPEAEFERRFGGE